MRSLGAKLLADVSGSLGQKALRIRQDRTLIHRVQKGERQPNEAFRNACLEAYSIPLDAWLEPDPEAEREAETNEAAPKSGPREVVDEPLAPGQTLEKLRMSAARTERLLRSPMLSTSAAAALEGRHQAALIAIQKIEHEGALENHPDFAQFLADIRGAIKDAFGDECTPERMRKLSESMRKRGKAKRLPEAA